jgi:hypothetical protein
MLFDCCYGYSYLFIYLFIYHLFFFFISQFTPYDGDTLTVNAAKGYYQETKWIIPNKEEVTINGESGSGSGIGTGTIVNVGLPLDDCFISCISGV